MRPRHVSVLLVGTCLAGVCLAGLGVSCNDATLHPTHVPALPQGAPPHEQAWCAFELALDADGRVQSTQIRVLGWEPLGAPATLFLALRQVASGTLWETASRAEAPRRAVLVLDGAGRALALDGVPAAVRARLESARRARRHAAEALTRTGTRVSEFDLGCAWLTLDALRSGAPFLYDDIRRWREIEAGVRSAAASRGGVWVCRLARTTHMGQFVFLDADFAVLGVREYILGE